MILWLFYERAMGVTVRLGRMENPEIRDLQPEMKMEMETEPEPEQ